MDSDFRMIKGGTFKMGDVVLVRERPTVRLDDFEIFNHAVTNREYRAFIDATGHRAPLHWIDGEIPVGKENHPVIFVDRLDVQQYCEWLGQRDGRTYRLPTYSEFEYASRGGMPDAKFPWGNDSPADRANFDVDGTRDFEDWQSHLQPALTGQPNGFGLLWHGRQCVAYGYSRPGSVNLSIQIQT